MTEPSSHAEDDPPHAQPEPNGWAKVGKWLAVGVALIFIVAGWDHVRGIMERSLDPGLTSQRTQSGVVGLVAGVCLLVRAFRPQLGFTRAWCAFLGAWFIASQLMSLDSAMTALHGHRLHWLHGRRLHWWIVWFLVMALGFITLLYGMRPKRGGISESIILAISVLGPLSLFLYSLRLMAWW